MTDLTEAVLSQLDRWRHLPGYQLERRADIFFAIWLPQVLETHCGCQVDPRLVPELPVRKALVSDRAQGHESVNIDYFALSRDRARGFLIELKTDMQSRRNEQDRIMRKAAETGWQALARGVCDIIRCTGSAARDRKYHYLAALLRDLGLLQMPVDLGRHVYADRRHGLSAALEALQPTPAAPALEVVYLQPRTGQPGSATTITFEQFAGTLDNLGEKEAATFARYLRRWAEDPAATPPPPSG